MGTFIAVIIIIALIFYALRDLLIDRDFSVWTNIALTSLILFTVILSIFMILHKPDDARYEIEKDVLQTPAEEREPEEQDLIQASQALADEYAVIENDCIKNNAVADCAGFTKDFLKKKYDIADEELADWLEEPAVSDMLQKARAAPSAMRSNLPSSGSEYMLL